jgi:predicted ester cyclase
MTTVERNKATASTFFEQVFNKGDFTAMSSLSPKYLYNGEPQNPQAFIAWVGAMRSKMPDLHFAIEEILGEDEKVALRWRMRGTTVGSATAPAGVAIETTGTNIMTFDTQGLCLTNTQNGYGSFTVPGQPPVIITDDAIYSPPAPSAASSVRA